MSRRGNHGRERIIQIGIFAAIAASAPATGMDLYWVSDTDTDWSNGLNWSLTSGGTGGAGYPGPTNDVYIDGGGSANCVLTETSACKDLTVSSTGYFADDGNSFSCVDFSWSTDAECEQSGNWIISGDYHAAADSDLNWDAGYLRFQSASAPTTINDIAGNLGVVQIYSDVFISAIDYVTRLSIEDGVEVEFDTGSSMQIEGYTSGDWDGAVLTSAAEWDLINPASMVVSDATITNSNATNEVDATDNCTDGGGNTNWTFVIPAFSWPQIYNFEGDTIGDDEATLEAKATHFDLSGPSGAVRAIDYQTLNAIRDNRLTKCWHGNSGNPPWTPVWFKIDVGAGNGFIPSAGGFMRMAGIFHADGSGEYATMYALSANEQEGVVWQMQENGSLYVSTRHLGVDTQKWSGSSGLTSSPNGGTCWYCLEFQHNFADLGSFAKVTELGLVAGDQEAPGLRGPTISGPTYDPNTEIRRFIMVTSNAISDDAGLAQLFVCDSSEGANNGAARTHNYNDGT